MSEISFPISDGQKLESCVARLLDEAGIPNFIWGETAVSILGTPSVVYYSGWAIPDDYIEAAAKVLDEAKFPPCTQGRENCTVFQMPTHPYPDYHWHTDLEYFAEPPSWTCGVFLYRKSRLFWTFPDPPIGAPGPEDPYYILTSDPRIKKLNRMARGRQSDDPAFYPVKMLTGARHAEAMFLLELRDFEGTRTLMHWQVLRGHTLGWAAQKDLEPNFDFHEIVVPFRRWAEKLWGTGPDDDPVAYRLSHQIYAEMKRNNQLPPPEEPGAEWMMRPLADRMRECNIPFDLA